MKLTPWRAKEEELDPFGQLEEMQNSLNRLWGIDFPRPMIRDTNGEKYFAPAVDITEEKDSITVKAEIPGMTKDQIEVSVHNEILTIRGEKRQEKEIKEKDYLRTERSYGSFQRSFSLPGEVDAQNVKAAYKDGVLEIVLPKKEGARSKQVKVEIK